jgi:DNA-binding IclR family transcriptional regulator
VVRIEEASGAVHVNMRIGSVMSLLGTATGRVFAAFLPPKMIENFVETGVGRASVGDEAARQMNRKQITAAVAEVRERGLARCKPARRPRETAGYSSTLGKSRGRQDSNRQPDGYERPLWYERLAW